MTICPGHNWSLQKKKFQRWNIIFNSTTKNEQTSFKTIKGIMCCFFCVTCRKTATGQEIIINKMKKEEKGIDTSSENPMDSMRKQ